MYMFNKQRNKYNYRRSPDSTVFVHPGNRTIEKTVLIGDCTKWGLPV